MKEKTYARLSLLLPFLLWGLCLIMYALVANLISANQFDSLLSTPIFDWIGRIIIFYVFGIIFWLLPYVLLFLILFGLTFKKQGKSLLYLFTLSPFAMAILMMVEAAIFSLIWPDRSAGPFDAVSSFQSSLGLVILFAIMSLAWGYICVGIGFGIYKLLRSSGILKDNFIWEPGPTLANG
ncbi:MAG: hypothetical protein ACM3XO_00750 [Bacteroidota bacterium]